MATKATAAQIAKFGPVAMLIKEQMTRLSLTPQDLAKQVGTTPSSVYNWMGAVNAPSAARRKLLARIFAIPVSSFSREATEAKPVAVAKPVAKSEPIVTRPADVLSFTVSGEGICHLRLDITLPFEAGVTLFQTLMDGGLTPKPEPKGDDLNGSDNAGDDA